MRLGALAPNALADPAAEVGAILDRRLLRSSPRPLAVALSGGGDSLALTLMAAGWARAQGRQILVLTVDHRLQPQSAAWTEACAATAARLGVRFQALPWIEEKPATGLPAAARAARHALLADAARAAGARVILMGHTADDLAETAQMRAAGSTTPDPREWAPSPAWPEGRGVFLLRPMLGLSRQDLREWLTAQGQTWIEDPANEDLRYARARARHLTAEDVAAAPSGPLADARALAKACRGDAAGRLAVPREAFTSADAEAQARFLAAACLCAGGTARPPARARVEALTKRIAAGEAFAASLAGARIEADPGEVRFLREAGEAARGGLAPLRVRAGEPAVWDGRFEVVADHGALARAAYTDEELPPSLRGLAARVRRTLPVGDSPIRIEALALPRLLAACGIIEREPE